VKSSEAPLGGEITMTSFPAYNKLRYLENHASQIKSYYGTLSVQKTFQFINVVNGVSQWRKTANISFSFDSIA